MKVNSRFLAEEQQLATLPGAMPSAPKPFNICGLIAHVADGRMGDVRAKLDAFAGVEVHAETEDGRLVITIEDTEEVLAAERITEVDRLPGVLNSSLVYHQFESHDKLELEEVSS
ncbi:chaperone NapD [Terasakiella sp. A23]|uniref:chaperone NapD n=1 Tax=Terasakiella sp. FCG-A23 TaxID=3080561 RepID=UPI002954E0BE|nr:chaperone NapD [Terasakiella sp. A23]MDV7338288.1 chaperone NapD [Terasakiella sp. A23]